MYPMQYTPQYGWVQAPPPPMYGGVPMPASYVDPAWRAGYGVDVTEDQPRSAEYGVSDEDEGCPAGRHAPNDRFAALSRPAPRMIGAVDFDDDDDAGVIVPVELSDNAQYWAFHAAVAAACSVLALEAEGPELSMLSRLVEVPVSATQSVTRVIRGAAAEQGRGEVLRVIASNEEAASRALVYQVAYLRHNPTAWVADAGLFAAFSAETAALAAENRHFGETVLEHLEELLRTEYIEGVDDNDDADTEDDCVTADARLVGLVTNLLSQWSAKLSVAAFEAYDDLLQTCVCRVLGVEADDCHAYADLYRQMKSRGTDPILTRVSDLAGSYLSAMAAPEEGFVRHTTEGVEVSPFLALPGLAAAAEAAAFIDLKAAQARQEHVTVRKTLPPPRVTFSI